MKAVKMCVAMALGALALTGCTPSFVTNSQGDVLLTITEIAGVAGAGPEADQDASSLFSDVVTGGGVINDNAKVSVRLDLKNGNNAVTAGSFNDVLLERYEVSFTRTDGHNTQGVDVPYAFSGPMAIRVSVGGATEAVFVIVRHEAKLEEPLRNMRDAGGLDVLHCIANITLHGRTTAGTAVQASGRLEVTFADFADQQ